MKERKYYVGKVWGPRGGYWQAARNIDYLSCEMLAVPPISIIWANSKRMAIKIARTICLIREL